MFFSPVFVDSASLRNGEHSQICGLHWIPSAEKRLVLKNASDSDELFLPDEVRTERNVEFIYHSCLTNQAILSIFLHKAMAGPHCRTGFSRGVVLRRFLGFSLY